MRKSLLSLFVCMVLCLPALGQDAQLTVDKNPTDPTGFAVVKFKMNKGDDVVWSILPKPTDTRTYIEGDYAVFIFNGPGNRTYTVMADWINWDAKKRGRPTVDVVIGTPAPIPVPPNPNPPEPAPGPVSSFSIFMVYEANSTLTSTQYGIIYGLDVENAMKSACNLGAKSGWRRLDKDTSPTTLPTGLKEAWTAAQSSIKTNNSAVPLIAFQVNDKITIEPLPATSADTVALIQKYRGK